MTDTPDQPPEQPSTEQIPIVRHSQVNKITVQPINEYHLGLPPEATEPTQVATPASNGALTRRPFRGARFAVDGDTVTALRYVQEGKGWSKVFAPNFHALKVTSTRVDTSLIWRRLKFTPEEGEDEIRYLQRHHWWMFGRVLVPHMLLWLTAFALYVSYGLDHYIGEAGLVIFALWLLAWLYFGGIQWQRWYCTVVLVTNTRIHHIRTYPVIRLTQHNIWLSKIDDAEVIPLKFGFHYAKLIVSIPGGGKSAGWLTKEGLSYLVDYEELEHLVKPRT